MGQDNKNTARRVREGIWTRKNPVAAEGLISPDCAFQVHDPLTPRVGKGPMGMKELTDVYLGAVPDAQCIVDEITGDGETIVVRWTATGTHSGPLLHIAPTGKRVTASGVDIYHFAEGKIQNMRIFWDAMGFAQQLG